MRVFLLQAVASCLGSGRVACQQNEVAVQLSDSICKYHWASWHLAQDVICSNYKTSLTVSQAQSNTKQHRLLMPGLYASE